MPDNENSREYIQSYIELNITAARIFINCGCQKWNSNKQ